MPTKPLVKIYDTTLRDGEQAENISFSLEDKVAIARMLDGLGVHYIEGGQASSNPKVMRFYQEMRKFGPKLWRRLARHRCYHYRTAGARAAGGADCYVSVRGSHDQHTRPHTCDGY